MLEKKKNQCIQYEYDPCIKEKDEYFHNPSIKIPLKLFSSNYRCIFNNLTNNLIHHLNWMVTLI